MGLAIPNTLKTERFQNRIFHYGNMNMTDVAITIDITDTKLPLTIRDQTNPLLQKAPQKIPPPR